MQKVLDFIKSHFKDLLIVGLVLFLFIRGCGPKPQPEIVTKIVHDTTVVTHRDTVQSAPKIIQVVKTKIKEVEKPSNNIDTLKRQYLTLLELHTTKNIYLDTLRIDTFGTVEVTDTVQYNNIVGRSYIYNLKERIITNTVTTTITNPPKREFFVGAGFGSTFKGNIDQANVGLLYKTKKGAALNLSVGYNFNQLAGQVNIGMYQKIRL